MKKKVIMLTTMALMGVLVGCTAPKKEATEFKATTVMIHNDNSISAVIIEDFSKDYYDINELTEMVNEETAEINAVLGADSISCVVSREGNTMVRLTLECASCQAYNRFQDEDLFVGSYEEALAAGYDLNVNLVNMAKPEETCIASSITNVSDYKVVVAPENANHLRCDKKIKYASEDTTVVDDFEINAYDNVDKTVILYK